MIRKISSKQRNTTIHHLENNDGTKITERVDKANRLAKKLAKIPAATITVQSFKNIK